MDELKKLYEQFTKRRSYKSDKGLQNLRTFCRTEGLDEQDVELFYAKEKWQIGIIGWKWRTGQHCDDEICLDSSIDLFARKK